MAKIMIDLDSTLYPFLPSLKRAAKEEGIITPLRPNNWNWQEDYITLSKFLHLIRRAHDPKHLSKSKPFRNSVEVFNRLKEHDIAIVSDNDPKDAKNIMKWLIKNKFLTKEEKDLLILFRDKREWIKENKPDVVIDDRVRTLLYARDLGISAFSLERSYNVNLKGEVNGIHICKDWLEIERELCYVIEKEKK